MSGNRGLRLATMLILALMALIVSSGVGTQREAHAQPWPEAGGTATVLLLDTSADMAAEWERATKLSAEQQAALDLVAVLQQESRGAGVSHRIAVVSFSTDARLDLPLTSDYASAWNAIHALTPEGTGNLEAGLQQAVAALGPAGEPARTIILLSGSPAGSGMAAAEMIAGPIAGAVKAGACIYAISFGERADPDDARLREIAEAGCGGYAHAASPMALRSATLEARHRALGTVLDRFEVAIARDEVMPARSYPVERDQDSLNVTLVWHGSRLDPELTDPEGRPVNANYPGATVAVYSRMAHVIVHTPSAGVWRLAVRGSYVPEGTTRLSALVSTRRGATTLGRQEPPLAAQAESGATSAAAAGDPVTVVAISVLGAAIILALIFWSARRQAAGIAPAGIAVQATPPQQATLRRGALTIGRHAQCELQLSDPYASAFHAHVVRTARGCFIEDLDSEHGTVVNGRRIKRQRLLPGTQIRIGRTWLVYWEQGRRR